MPASAPLEEEREAVGSALWPDPRTWVPVGVMVIVDADAHVEVEPDPRIEVPVGVMVTVDAAAHVEVGPDDAVVVELFRKSANQPPSIVKQVSMPSQVYDWIPGLSSVGSVPQALRNSPVSGIYQPLFHSRGRSRSIVPQSGLPPHAGVVHVLSVQPCKV